MTNRNELERLQLMTTEEKALAGSPRFNEQVYRELALRYQDQRDAAIEAHEADKKAFSDAVSLALTVEDRQNNTRAWRWLSPFILHEPEPDPLDQLLDDTAKVMLSGPLSETWHEALRKAARGYKIERIEQ